LAKNGGSWGRALIAGLPAAALILALFSYWFAVADRYIIFLYYHDMGPRVPDSSPFSRVTSSRYWMAGLVAAGTVMLLYLGANWLLGRLSKSAHAPMWWRVWLVAAPLLLMGIPAITMGFNDPVLPCRVAMRVTLLALIGVALALLPGELAARNPVQLLWLAADGWGLALILLTLAHLEDFRLWLSMGGGWRLAMGLVLMLSGLLWLLLLSFLRAWLHIPVDGIVALFLAGFCVAYLLIPFVHHTLATDGYFYLTNSDNFFARGLGMQLVFWLGTALVSWGIVRLRLALAARLTILLPKDNP
jgi:hypothetical protein